MFPRQRARLNFALNQSQSELQAAQDALTHSQQAVGAQQNAVVAATSQLNAAQSTFTAAQTAYNQAGAAVADAEDRLAAAEDALDSLDIDGPTGKPRPGSGIQRTRLQKAVTDAQNALSAAKAAAATAQSALGPAAARVAAAQNGLDSAQAALQANTAAAAAAQQVIDRDAPQVDRLKAELATLDNQENQVTGVPLDRAAVARAADAQTATRQARRGHLYDQRRQRLAVLGNLSSTLAAADAAIDQVAGLSGDLRALDWFSRYPALATIADQVDAVVRASQPQRGRTATDRSDDLATYTVSLQAALAALGQVASAAAADQATADSALDNANQTIANLRTEWD